MTEVEKLEARIGKMHEMGMKNIRFSWGPSAKGMTDEELAKAINEALDAPGEPIEQIDRNMPTIRFDAPFEQKQADELWRK